MPSSFGSQNFIDAEARLLQEHASMIQDTPPLFSETNNYATTLHFSVALKIGI